jgi:hypothetical protein
MLRQLTMRIAFPVKLEIVGPHSGAFNRDHVAPLAQLDHAALPAQTVAHASHSWAPNLYNAAT